jgi:hypothetical protein
MIEPVALQAVCDVLDANPFTLQLILPRDKERVAGCVEPAERAMTREASMLLMVTADDEPAALVEAGEVLQRLLLTITSCGLHYSFLHAAMETAESRECLRALVGSKRPPQVLLRIASTDVM